MLLSIDFCCLQIDEPTGLRLEPVVLLGYTPHLLHILKGLIILLHLDEAVGNKGENPSTTAFILPE